MYKAAVKAASCHNVNLKIFNKTLLFTGRNVFILCRTFKLGINRINYYYYYYIYKYI